MSQYQIDIEIDPPGGERLAELLADAAKLTLSEADVTPSSGLAILLTNDKRVRQLNAAFRGINEETDVLSFPAGETMPGMSEAETVTHLGDVAISIPYAERQAAASGHSLEAELQLLVVHGVLHLLGHDHAEDEEKAQMWVAQAAVLDRLGLSSIAPE